MEVDTEENVDEKEVEVRRDEIVEQEENRVLETQADNKIQVEPMGSQMDLEPSQEDEGGRRGRRKRLRTKDKGSPVEQSPRKPEPEDSEQFRTHADELLAEIRDEKAEEAEKKAQADYEDGAKSRPWRRREEQRLPEGEVTIEEAEEEQVPKASGAKKRGPKTKKKPGSKELKDNSIFHEFPGNKVRVILIHNNAFLLISIPV